jgi:hypothetical protein
MLWATRLGVLLAATWFVASVTFADQDLEFEWSGTFELRLQDFESPVDDDDKTGFFDQYEFTRNKDDEPTIEFGLSEFDLDLLGASETPRLQFRLRSPTSDLSVSGGRFAIAESFLNQRGKLYTRLPGLALDLDYRRLRTEELRVFNNAGWLTDDTTPDNRFYVRRSRIGGELRLRPRELLTGERGALANFLSEIALRGGVEERKGRRQTRTSFLNQLTSELDQQVRDGGAGLVFNPAGLFTLALDIDHQRFIEDAPPDQGTGQTIAFIPDTDRTTGTLRLNSRVGKGAVIHGGLQFSSLRQERTRTDAEKLAGQHRNKLFFYSGNFGTDLQLTDTLSLNGFLKFDHRRNQTERDTAFFDPTLAGQDYPFLERVRRIETGTEFVYRLPHMNRVSLGVRGEWIDRDLDFSSPGLTPQNTMVDEDTRTFTAYIKTRLRPALGLNVSGELGYRNSPDTGYIRELDNVGYGRLRVSYTLPLARPVTLSLFGRGETGENHDFNQLQDFDLWTNPSRFTGLDFSLLDPLDYRARVGTATLGGTIRISDKTDVSLSYSFTRSNWRFESNNATTEIIDGLSRIRSDLQRAQVEVRHWLRDGFRVSGGYRFDKYRDRTDVSTGTGSVDPFSDSTKQHVVTFAVTLNSDILRKP